VLSLAPLPLYILREQLLPSIVQETRWDVMEKRKISCPYWELNPDSLVIQPVA
jgi:hypothetical protein